VIEKEEKRKGITTKREQKWGKEKKERDRREREREREREGIER
jgi:hypothetical protein